MKIGELWAVAISLRIVLVENLRRLASRIVISRQEREDADALAEELIELARKNPDELPAYIKKRLVKHKEPGHAFIVQLTRQLCEQDPLIARACEIIQKTIRE